MTTKYESISDERIDKSTEKFCDGKAGRGDSPYDEEFHKKFTGQKNGKKKTEKREWPSRY